LLFRISYLQIYVRLLLVVNAIYLKSLKVYVTILLTGKIILRPIFL